jgi:outer membrane protein assembly factor BamA|tara:strand:- start:263 stop:775 length:513 start_codon:yes stop_codon:yes gene_type:complete
LVSGVQLQLKSSLVSLRQKEENFFGDHSFRFVFYKLFKNNHNFAFQFLVSGNNLKNSQYLNYIGGLSEVRGYRDGQFYDQTFYQSNIEHRFDLYHHSWGVIQAVVFTDQAKEAQTLAKITESKDEILLSSGIGLRFISPKIFRFVGRLDYAQTHTRFVDQNISFGIQQFF